MGYTLKQDTKNNIPVVITSGPVAYVPPIGTNLQTSNESTEILDVLTEQVGPVAAMRKKGWKPTANQQAQATVAGDYYDQTVQRGNINNGSVNSGSFNSRTPGQYFEAGEADETAKIPNASFIVDNTTDTDSTNSSEDSSEKTRWGDRVAQPADGIYLPEIEFDEDALEHIYQYDYILRNKNTYNTTGVYVPTVQVLKDSINVKNGTKPNTRKYSYISYDGLSQTYKIEDSDIKGGLSHVLAYSNTNFIFTSGQAQTAQQEVNNAKNISTMSFRTYVDKMNTALLARRKYGDVELVGNFEVGYAGPIDARIVTPSRATLKDPEWWLGSNTTPKKVYIYRGMLVSIQATQELVMYRGADVIIAANSTAARKALDDNMWTLISQDGQSNSQTLDDGNDITLNSTVTQTNNEEKQVIIYDSSIITSGKNKGITLVALCDPEQAPDTKSKIGIKADYKSANISLTTSKEDTENSSPDNIIWNNRQQILMDLDTITLQHKQNENKSARLALESGVINLRSKDESNSSLYETNITVSPNNLTLGLEYNDSEGGGESAISMRLDEIAINSIGDLNLNSWTDTSISSRTNTLIAAGNDINLRGTKIYIKAGNVDQLKQGVAKVADLVDYFEDDDALLQDVQDELKRGRLQLHVVPKTAVASDTTYSAEAVNWASSQERKYQLINVNSKYSGEALTYITKLINTNVIALTSYGDIDIQSVAGCVRIGNPSTYIEIGSFDDVSNGMAIKLNASTLSYNAENTKFDGTIEAKNAVINSSIQTSHIDASTINVTKSIKLNNKLTLFDTSDSSIANKFLKVNTAGDKIEYTDVSIPTKKIFNMTTAMTRINYLISVVNDPQQITGSDEDDFFKEQYTVGMHNKVYYDEHGDLFASAFYQSSDVNLKTNITNIDIVDLDNLPTAKNFNWNYEQINDYKTSGYIAQELEEIGYNRFVSIDNDGMRKVNYVSLLSYEVEVLKHHLKIAMHKINELTEQLNYIRN